MSSGTVTGLLHSTHSLELALRELGRWLRQEHLFPLTPTTQAKLELSREQLEVRVRQFQADPSLLSIMFVGGTGVGKSSLLNALAKSKVAESGIVRPTTQRPTVYHHREVDLSKLDPAIGKCAAVSHDRPELRHKLIIDTPDMDGNVKEHRERLRAILPVADAVLYVGSQEKYHDIEAWKLLLEHRGTRGFAFILNKWDRCLAYRDESTGDSPDQDFRHSLQQAGFENPLVFRTCAAKWVSQNQGNAVAAPIEDDFLALERWLDAGLNERVVRDIKVRGIGAKIDALIETLRLVIPPDWTVRSDELKRDWQLALQEGLADQTQLLIEATDKNAAALEEHFSTMGRGDFRGLFALYLIGVDYLRRLKISPLPNWKKVTETGVHALASRTVVTVPMDTRLAHQHALRSHLLALADRKGWPIETFEKFVPDDGQHSLDEGTLTYVVQSELANLERNLAEPTGQAYATRLMVKSLCDWLPLGVVGLILLKFLYDIVVAWEFGLSSIVGSGILFVITLMGLHLLVAKTVPVRWSVLRNRFRERVLERLVTEIAPRYLQRLEEFTAQIAAERATPVAALEILEGLRKQLGGSEDRDAAASLFPKQMR